MLGCLSVCLSVCVSVVKLFGNRYGTPTTVFVRFTWSMCQYRKKLWNRLSKFWFRNSWHTSDIYAAVQLCRQASLVCIFDILFWNQILFPHCGSVWCQWQHFYHISTSIVYDFYDIESTPWHMTLPTKEIIAIIEVVMAICSWLATKALDDLVTGKVTAFCWCSGKNSMYLLEM